MANQNIKGRWTVIDTKTKSDIAEFDTFLGYESTNDNQVCSYPIEKGSFTSYNKVINPNRINVYLAKSGQVSELQNMLASLEKYTNGIELVDIVLPFKTYARHNIEKMNHSIKEGDASNQLVVELVIPEIRETDLSYSQNTLSDEKVASPDLADTKNVGKKQGETKDKSWLKSLRESVYTGTNYILGANNDTTN